MTTRHHCIEMNHFGLPIGFVEIMLSFVTITMKKCNFRKEFLKAIFHMMQNLNDVHVFQR